MFEISFYNIHINFYIDRLKSNILYIINTKYIISNFARIKTKQQKSKATYQIFGRTKTNIKKKKTKIATTKTNFFFFFLV